MAPTIYIARLHHILFIVCCLDSTHCYEIYTETKTPNCSTQSASEHVPGGSMYLMGWDVDCSRSNLTVVPPLSNLSNPTISLNISLNEITHIDNYAFESLKFLISLDLSKNRISVLSSRAFVGLWKLRYLYLSGNQLAMTKDTYHVDMFCNLVSLEELHLINNINESCKKYTYPARALSNLVSLKYLSIDGLKNQSLGSEMEMGRLVNLSTLVMSGFNGFCKINYIDSSFFDNIVNIEELTLENCEITTINESAMKPLLRIRILNINSNTILDFDGLESGLMGLNGSMSLREVNIQGIHNPLVGSIILKRRHLCWMKYTQITTIYLDHNRIEGFGTYVIGSCIPKTLSHLYVSHNVLWTNAIWTLDLLTLPALQYVDVTHALIGDGILSGYFPLQSSLRTLIFRENSVHTWLYVSTSSLETVDFSDNFCWTIHPDFFYNCPKITTLLLRRTALGKFLVEGEYKNVFSKLLLLEQLDLSENFIRSLPKDLLKNQTSLENLTLRMNSLAEFNLEISHMTGLILVDLSFNMIGMMSHVAMDSFDRLGSITQIDITGNVLDCSCENMAYLRWLKTYPNITHGDNYKCRLTNGSVIEYSSIRDIVLDLDGQCSVYYIALFAIIVIIAYIIAICCAMVYRHQSKLKYLYRLSRAKYYGNTNIKTSTYTYDALVLYAEEDREFVTSLSSGCVPNLEISRGLKLCIPDRDFLPGRDIANTILEAIHITRHTIIVLSRNFVACQWCRYGFNMAQVASIHNDRDVVILVDYSTVPREMMPAEIEEVRQIRSYLTYNRNDYDEHSFWDALSSEIKRNEPYEI